MVTGEEIRVDFRNELKADPKLIDDPEFLEKLFGIIGKFSIAMVNERCKTLEARYETMQLRMIKAEDELIRLHGQCRGLDQRIGEESSWAVDFGKRISKLEKTGTVDEKK